MQSMVDQPPRASAPARRELAIVGGLATISFVVLWALSGLGPGSALVAGAAMSGAAAAALLVPRRPVAAVGVVFLLAGFSRIVLALPVGDMRLEQPALVALIAATIWHRRALALPDIRPLVPLAAAALVYVAALTISSTLVADQPAVSLRLVAWTGLSMLGGLSAAVLVAGRAAQLMPWLGGAAAVVGTIGLLAALAYTLLGVGAPWMSSAREFDPRAHGFTHEPNLYASLLAAALPLAIEHWRRRPSLGSALVALLLLGTIGLGVTRAAYIGLAVALLLYFVLTVWREGFGRRMATVGAAVVLAGAVGLALPTLLLNPANRGLLVTERPPPPPPAVPGDPGQPRPREELQTWEYRMERVRIGLAEMAESPLIGRGAFSYGQRHVGPLGVPEVISVWPVTVAHDAGLIGLAGLLGFLLLLARRLWRVVLDHAGGGTAIAFGASLTVLLIAYLATTALHFAVTWLFIGGALAATLEPGDARGRRPEAPAA